MPARAEPVGRHRSAFMKFWSARRSVRNRPACVRHELARQDAMLQTRARRDPQVVCALRNGAVYSTGLLAVRQSVMPPSRL